MPDVGPDVCRKAELEIAKLELELLELKQWWRRPAYVQGLLSVVVASTAAVATLSMGYVNGWFDAQRARLEVEKARISSDIERLKTGRDELNVQVASLKGEMLACNNRITKLQRCLRASELKDIKAVVTLDSGRVIKLQNVQAKSWALPLLAVALSQTAPGSVSIECPRRRPCRGETALILLTNDKREYRVKVGDGDHLVVRATNEDQMRDIRETLQAFSVKVESPHWPGLGVRAQAPL